MIGTVGNGGMSKAVLCVMAPVGMSNPGGIYGTLVGPDSGVQTFQWDTQWKVWTPGSGPAKVPEMPPRNDDIIRRRHIRLR